MAGFDPSKVGYRHIRRVTLLWGDDAPGIRLRLRTFSDVLRESGHPAQTVRTVDDAVDTLSSGGLFGDDIQVICDAGRPSKREVGRLASAVRALVPSYSRDSHVVIAVASDDAPGELIAAVEEAGGLAREVSAGDAGSVRWAREYAASIGVSLGYDDASDLMRAVGDDTEQAAAILDSMGQDMVFGHELRESYGLVDRRARYGISRALANADVEGMLASRDTYAAAGDGGRAFMQLMRNSMGELAVARDTGLLAADIERRTKRDSRGAAMRLARLADGVDEETLVRAYLSMALRVDSLGSGYIKCDPVLSAMADAVI